MGDGKQVRVEDIQECEACGFAIFFFDGSQEDAHGGYRAPAWYHVGLYASQTCRRAVVRPKALPNAEVDG